jgi:LPXTG-motif cell wall-anchored protein
MLVLVLLALTVPAVSLADGGGGSAGDQQYTDPFSSTSGGATSTAPATTTSAALTPTATSSPAPSTTPPSSAAPTTSADPTATIATATATASSKTLPYTGYDAWTAVGFGLALVAGGMVLRRRTHRA